VLKAHVAKSRRYLEARPARSRLETSQGIALLSALFALRPLEVTPPSREPTSLAARPATAHALAANLLDRALLLADPLTPSGSPGLISISKSSTRQPTHPSTSCPSPELSTPIDKSESSLSPLTFCLARRRWRKTEQIADPLVSSVELFNRFLSNSDFSPTLRCLC
jgi:hypothetical protein